MRIHLVALMALTLASGCAVGTGAVVKGAGPKDLLKLREGPGLNYRIIVGLPDGTPLTRQNCVTNKGKVWCRVTLTNKPEVSGYVSAEYLGHR